MNGSLMVCPLQQTYLHQDSVLDSPQLITFDFLCSILPHLSLRLTQHHASHFSNFILSLVNSIVSTTKEAIISPQHDKGRPLSFPPLSVLFFVCHPILVYYVTSSLYTQSSVCPDLQKILDCNSVLKLLPPVISSVHNMTYPSHFSYFKSLKYLKLMSAL